MTTKSDFSAGLGAPFIPDGWEIRPEDQITSRFTGELTFTPDAVRLYLDAAQQGSGVVKGTELVKSLEGQPVLQANVLDYYIANPELIPVSWKGKDVFFWGTIYRDSNGDLCVRYLCGDDSVCHWSYDWLGRDCCSMDPAAVPAS